MLLREDIENFLNSYTIEMTPKVYEKVVIALNDPSLSIWFCEKFGDADVRSHEKIILNSNNPRHYYNFARLAKGANVKLLKESAFVFGDAKVMILFASTFPELGISDEQEYIIGLNNPEYACMFAERVPGCDVERLEKIVIDSNDYVQAYSFASGVKGANIKPLEDIVIKSNNPTYIYLFAKTVEGANKEKLVEALLKLRDIHTVLDYSTNVEYISYEKIKANTFDDEDVMALISEKNAYDQIISVRVKNKARLIS